MVERDDLQKDIEQLCMQQGGSGYIAIATQMYCRRYTAYQMLSRRLSCSSCLNDFPFRTAGLEQEVENLKKKLADYIKENSNIKDELSEAKRIKVSFHTFLF